MSAAAFSKVFNNEPSRRLVEKRSELDGGYFDCVVAIASAMAKVFPIDCPFITRYPAIENFSLFGGIKNHIHLVKRTSKGENLGGNCSYEGFILLTKAIDANPNETERELIGRKIVIQNSNSKTTLELNAGYMAKLEGQISTMNWYESNEELVILSGSKVFHRLPMKNAVLVSQDGRRTSIL
jgi:hypothetical protein